MKLFGKLCAATVASTMLLAAAPTATPVAHAKIKWGAAAGAILGGIINSSTGHSSSGRSGGLFSGLSNQKHARQNPTSEEKLFMLAIEQNDFETAQQMLDAGVDINGVYPGTAGINYSYGNGRTAFQVALGKGNRDMMQFLLEHKANVKGFYTYGNDYLSYIEMYAHYKEGAADTGTLQYLLDWGADVNDYSSTHDGKKTYPIDHCTRNYGNIDGRCFTTQYLIDKGAYLENKDQYGMTPFLRAVNQNHPRIMHILANSGANINIRDNSGRNASQIAIDNGNMAMYKEVQDIMARGQQPSKYQEKKTESQKKK